MVILPALLLTGRIPALYTTVPAISGRVVNTAGNPVAHAPIRIRSLPISFGKDLDIVIFSDSSGHFFREAETTGTVYIVPGDTFGSRYEVSVDDSHRACSHAIVQGNWLRIFGLGRTPTADLLKYPAEPLPPRKLK